MQASGWWIYSRGTTAASFDRKIGFTERLQRSKVDGHRIRLLKPMTYMNESGRSVAAVKTYYKVPLEHVLLAYDELDLSPGRAQLKFDGGHGGHNGMRNVVECVGKKFWRLRLGIGHPGPGRRDQVTNYVLQRPSAEDQEAILNAVVAGVEALPVFLDEGEKRRRPSFTAGMSNHALIRRSTLTDPSRLADYGDQVQHRRAAKRGQVDAI
ncbi:MAG: hypothetical protein CM1200mP36_02330 [Gammaproteobacteria bacterium]|nr:MAG: hypothetical protein CM1200mP36_02330 [Gammaproteobacteria bacterium]